MTLAALSLCGPRQVLPRRTEVTDARTAQDPTGTGRIRSAMRRESDARWGALARGLRQSLIEHDLIGIRGIGQLPFGSKVEGFSAWLKSELDHKVFGYNGSWTRPYVQRAAQIAGVHAETYVPGAYVDAQRVAEMAALAVTELKGIVETAQQKITRCVTQCLMSSTAQYNTANQCSAVIRNMRQRSRAMNEYIIAKTHSTSTLSAFRGAGIQYVGTIPERKSKFHIAQTQHGKVLVKDAGPEDEPRDPHGRWTSAGNEYSSEVAEKIDSIVRSMQIDAAGSSGSLRERVVVMKRDTGKVIADYTQELELDVPSLTHVLKPGSMFSNANWFNEHGDYHPDNSIIDLHTHPIDQSFSDGDWRVFSRHTIGEMRVVTPKTVFSLQKTKEFTDMPWQERTPAAINKVFNGYVDEISDDILKTSGTNVPDDFVDRVIAEANVRTAHHFKIKYDAKQLESAQIGDAAETAHGKVLVKDAFDPDEPRDPHGRWTSDLASFSKKWSDKGVRNFIVDRPARGEVQLSDLVVPKEQQGEGIGTKFMEEFVDLADKHGRTITLTAAQRDDQMGTTSTARLKRFYKRFGFVENKGRNIDFTISDTMYRRPKAKSKDAVVDLDELWATAEALVEKAEINRDYDVIELSNRSRDGKTVYIDKHVPEVLKDTGIRPDQTLPWHELSEWTMQNRGLSYLPAHKIATQIEKRRVEQIEPGAWDEYQDEMGGLIADAEERGYGREPPNQDRRVFDARLEDKPPDQPPDQRVPRGGRQGPGSRVSRKRMPSGRTIRRIRATQKKLEEEFGEGLVEIVTAGDDDVCIRCEEASDEGPYSLDEAEALVPLHPWCRCSFFPAGKYERDALLDYDPDEPRDPLGKWTTGGGASGQQEQAGAGGRQGSGGRASGVEEASRKAEETAGGWQPLKGLPQKPLTVGGVSYVPGPVGWIQESAKQYMDKTGLPYQRLRTYQSVDVNRAHRIAGAFDLMKHDPSDPEVKASYDALIKETHAQYLSLQNSGVKFEPIPDGMSNPYAETPRLAQRDLVENKHMWFFPTTSGFGTGPEAEHAIKDNPMLRPTGEKIGNHAMLANDEFRVVHDVFGHFKEGVGFRAGGEENAWRSHSTMYSDAARGAMTSETRGQNSWVNYGPHGETNRTASESETVFAPQKIGLMPKWTWEEGRGDPVKDYNPYHAPAGTPEGGQFTSGEGAGGTGDPHGRWMGGGTEFPKAGLKVAGLNVLSDVPNIGSIESSLTNYEEILGIREVPISEFENSGPPKFYSVSEEERTKRLAEQIKSSGEIKPLIVVVESKNLKAGPYILEGGHRFDAIKMLGKRSFPAKVIISHDDASSERGDSSDG